ncbi:MAG: cohesin domain-containing protein [bacterium]|nr:cohesin domain-containing protein [bacterium]
MKNKIFKIIFLLFLFQGGIAEAATLRLTPAIGSFILGSTFDVSVIMNTNNVPINTIEAELNFPADKLQIANPSLGHSIVQIWASPPTFSNREGRIYFIGGIPSPGINTSEGVVQSFTFRVVAPGEAKISFGKNTSVLANDGLGTDILKQTSPAEFKLLLPPLQGPDVFSPTHPEQGKWYRDPNPILKWSASSNSSGFSYLIDHSPNTAPPASVMATSSEATFDNLESGIWYFHVREKAGGTWGGTSHYILNIDSLPPAEFNPEVSPSARTSNKNPIFRFFTTDSLSGFDYFQIKLIPLKSGPTESSFFYEVSSPYQFSNLKIGRYEAIVRAYDKAGNFRDGSAVLNIIFSPLSFINSEGIDFIFFFMSWPAILSILISITFFMSVFILIIWIRHRHHLQHAFKDDFKNLWPF